MCCAKLQHAASHAPAAMQRYAVQGNSFNPDKMPAACCVFIPATQLPVKRIRQNAARAMLWCDSLCLGIDRCLPPYAKVSTVSWPPTWGRQHSRGRPVADEVAAVLPICPRIVVPHGRRPELVGGLVLHTLLSAPVEISYHRAADRQAGLVRRVCSEGSGVHHLQLPGFHTTLC